MIPHILTMKSINFLDGMSLHIVYLGGVKENYGQEIENSETFLDVNFFVFSNLFIIYIACT